MKIRTVVRLGIFFFIMLVMIGVGRYGFTRLGMSDRNRELNLFSYVPASCIGVFETDNLDFLASEFAQITYAEQLDTLQHGGLWGILQDSLKRYVGDNVHQLANHVNRVVVSFHSKEYSEYESIVYFRLSEPGKDVVKQMLEEKTGSVSLVAEQGDREELCGYSFSASDTLWVYEEQGFLAVSYQRYLMEQVVDVSKKGSSLWEESLFAVQYHEKEPNFATLYTRSVPVPALISQSAYSWSEYELHLNSEVFYLSGSISEADSELQPVAPSLHETSSSFQDGLWIVSGQHKVDSCISSTVMKPEHTLFEECVSNLSREASYIMVADIDKVVQNTSFHSSYIPPFLAKNLHLFRSFILSVQLTVLDNRISHIFVFTYKN